MKNRVPLGNGKSRIAKFNLENINSFDDFKSRNDIDGVFHDSIANNALTGPDVGVEEIGTPLNDVTLLSQDVAELVGLTESNATPSNAIKKLYNIATYTESPEMHRMIFRGKNLGSSVTTAHQTSIQNGSFNDLFVGDYWIINGVTWRIVDINYWLYTGDISFTANHLVIMPDNQLYTAPMNSTNITTGGYAGSLMHTTNLNQAKTTINSAFGTMVKTHRQNFTNTVVNGKPTAGAMYDVTVHLPNEINMYGSHIFAPANDGVTIPYLFTIDKTQFSLFSIKPELILGGSLKSPLWLRDVVSAGTFAAVYGPYGTSHQGNASTAYGVRPCFAIG